MNGSEDAAISAEERKRRRLEAWRRRQEQQQPQQQQQSTRITLQLKPPKKPTAHKKTPVAPVKSVNPFFVQDDESDLEKDYEPRTRKRPLDMMEDITSPTGSSKRTKGAGRRWDTAPQAAVNTINNNIDNNPAREENPPVLASKDLLDQFMEKLEAGASGTVTVGVSDGMGEESLSINVGSSMWRSSVSGAKQAPVSGGVITAEGLQKLHQSSFEKVHAPNASDDDIQQPLYHPRDWLSDAPSDTDDETEEDARRALIDALKSTLAPSEITTDTPEDSEVHRPAQTAAEVRNEKSRREERLRQLEEEAAQARRLAKVTEEADLGRLYEDEGGIMEEAERNFQLARAAPDALTIIAELNKKKELKAVDHSKIEYLPFQKNLYRVPRSLAQLTNDDVINRRAKLKVRVRGHGAPAPVSTFTECGLSEKILEILSSMNITEPFPVQAQCMPCIMAGRDVIGIAKTGSGKTLAYLLPMLRHILIQPPLGPNESGPIGLILAPARELAYQIHIVCKSFSKQLGLKSTAVYGGAGVAEQIGDLKRGAHVVVATPGRLIDILTMQSGKILSLKRVTFVVMDEADRMYDMGFAPQITAILAAIRPDRQTVLFSATFPKAIETLARKSLKYPIEVVVGGRSVASDNITQYAELIEEDEKFWRLLQILGEQVEGTKKVIVFVDTQVHADNLFEQLLRNGYPTLSLHGGKDQEDRDSTIADFKRKDGPNVLVATGVAGRGLDVPLCTCVVNYSAPNHLEAYVHQTGRTGRAGNTGVCYTFVNSTEEAKYAPIIVRAMSEAGQSENISESLKNLSDDFKNKVERGEAKYAGSGFKGKGYTYDASEMTEAQRMANMEKRQALIEAGLLDPDDEDPLSGEAWNKSNKEDGPISESSSGKTKKIDDFEIPDNLTPELLALPGMKEALLRKAGIVPSSEGNPDASADPSMGVPVRLGDNHWLQEFEINEYPREARWKVTQKDTTSRLQDEFRTAVTLKGSYFPPGKEPGDGERRLYLHLEAASEQALKNCVLEIQRILNEETLRVGAKSLSGSGTGSHRYNVLA